MDSLLGQFAFSLNRSLEFVVDRMWIDVITLGMLLYLPSHQRDSFPSELMYAITATFILYMIREQFLRPKYDKNVRLGQLLSKKLAAKDDKSELQ